MGDFLARFVKSMFKCKNLLNTVILWNSNSNKITIIPWSNENDSILSQYDFAWGACNDEIHKCGFEERVKLIRMFSITLIVHEKISPKYVHDTLSNLEEYCIAFG